MSFCCLLKSLNYQSCSNIINPRSFCLDLETAHSDKACFINTKIALQYPYIYIHTHIYIYMKRKTSTFHKYIIHKICSQNTFMHFPISDPCLYPKCLSWEGQGLETGSCLQVAPNPGEGVGVKSCLSGANLASPEKPGSPAHYQSCTSCPSTSSQKPPSISPLPLLVFPAVTRE